MSCTPSTKLALHLNKGAVPDDRKQFITENGQTYIIPNTIGKSGMMSTNLLIPHATQSGLAN